MKRAGPAGGSLCRGALACLLGMVLAGSAHAVTYYLSSTGSDDSDGTAPESAGPAGPWKTFANLARTRLRQGDQVLLRCGDRFMGPIAIEVAGTGGGPFRLGRYGPCENGQSPVIDGARRVNAAPSKADKGLRVAPLEGDVAQVFWNDEPVPVARHPRATYLVADEAAGSPMREVPATGLPSTDLAGAGVTARTYAWFIEERRVTGVSGSAATLDRPLDYPLDAGSGYFFTGRSWMIGGAPAWGIDRKSRSLVVRLPQGAVQGGPLAVSLAGPLVRIAAGGTVYVDGLALERAGGIALDISTAGPVEVDAVSIRNAALGGIRIQGASTVRVEQCDIRGAGGDGIMAQSSRSAVIRANVLRDIATGPVPRPTRAAINALSAAGAWISGNVVSGAGYIGIRFRDGATVEGNIVENACTTMSDCGAIYSWRDEPSDRQPPSLVAGNTIVSVKGNQEIKPGWRRDVAGIYLDDHVANVQVQGNVIVGARHGIYLHNVADSTLEGNVVLFSDDASLYVTVDSAKYPPQRQLQNVIRANGLLFDLGEEAILMIHRTHNKVLRSFADNIVTGNPDPPPVHQFHNEGTPQNPRYRRLRVPLAALAAEGESNATERSPAGLPSKGGVTSWRVERTAAGVRVTEGSGRVVVLQSADPGGDAGLAAGGMCRLFGGPKPGEPGAAWRITLCHHVR